MNEEYRANPVNPETPFSRQVGAQAARKLKARRLAPKSVWFGLGMSGLVGWSVTLTGKMQYGSYCLVLALLAGAGITLLLPTLTTGREN